MKLIGEGGKIQLAIPSDLGYGTYGNRGIEPNSVLLFDVTLNKIGKFVAPAEEPKKK
jgi:FKBP-type peptidyl-prolyl cis-trans isomerase